MVRWVNTNKKINLPILDNECIGFIMIFLFSFMYMLFQSVFWYRGFDRKFVLTGTL